MRVDVVSRASFTCAGGVSGPDFTRARVWCGEVLDVGRMARDYGPGSERLVLGCRAQSVLLLRTVGVVWGAVGQSGFKQRVSLSHQLSGWSGWRAAIVAVA